MIVPNSPLSNKHNAALDLALKDPEWTHVMLLPSDDFIDPRWIVDGIGDYVMPSRCGMYDVATGRSKVLVCKPRGARHFGAGRVVSRKALEDVSPLWREGKERGLDTLSHARLTAAGWEMEVRHTDYLPVTDIKTDHNLWGFDTFARNEGAAEDVLAMIEDRATIQALR